MKKVAFIIPGFGHSPDQEEYQQIGHYFKSKSITPVFVSVKWNYSTISQEVDEFLKLFENIQADYTCIVGFSFGALIAYIAASKVSVDTLILCSLSPYLSEDLPVIKSYWKTSIGKKRLNDLQSLKNSQIAAKVAAKTYLLFGDKEGPEIEQRASNTFNELKTEKKLICLQGVKHDLSDQRYLDQLQRVISQLSI